MTMDIQRITKTLAIATTVIVATLFATMSTATAADSKGLTKYLSAQNDIVIGLNISSLSSNKYFDKIVEWARTQSEGGDLLEAFEKDSGLDIDKDISAVAIAIRNQQTMNQQQENQEFAMAVSGNFKSKKVLAAIEKQGADVEQKKVAGLTFYKNEDVWLAIPKDGLALMTAGDDAYTKKNIATFGNQKNSISGQKAVKKMLGQVDTSKDIWMAGDTSKMKAQSEGPKPQSLGMELDFSSGLNLGLVAEMKTAKDAKASIEQMDQMKAQGDANPFVAMMGAKPLITNLDAKTKGTQVRVETKMNQKEFDAMVAALQQLAASQMGAGSGGATTPPAKGEPKQDDDGAEADFN